MSRIGRTPIVIPGGVTVTLEGRTVTVKGPKGELRHVVPTGLAVRVVGEAVVVELADRVGETMSALWGLTRALMSNMVEGVSRGFVKKLMIEGIGYRAEVSGRDLVFALGFSHPVRVSAPEGIEFAVTKNVVMISGIHKELVGQVAAQVRSLKPPEPYKGKGIRYENEVVRRKAGKKAVAAGK